MPDDSLREGALAECLPEAGAASCLAAVLWPFGTTGGPGSSSTLMAELGASSEEGGLARVLFS